MNDIYVLNQDFERIGIIDEYVSNIWRRSFSEIGDFELYLGANENVIELLQKNRYLVRSCDIKIIDGVTSYKKVMIIKNMQLVTDVENGDYLTITGRELKFLLHQRIVWSQTSLTGTVEDGIRQLVTENAISPTDENRKIPNLILADAIGLTDKIEKQITGDNLDQAIVEICKTFNIGWDMYISGGKIVFELCTGIDRSYGQSAVPYVVFSDDFDNLYNTDYQLNSEEYANTTLIGGEGEGINRFYTTLGAENSGLNRFEVFTDARDISQNKEEAGEVEAIPEEQIKNKLPVISLS